MSKPKLEIPMYTCKRILWETSGGFWVSAKGAIQLGQILLRVAILVGHEATDICRHDGRMTIAEKDINYGAIKVLSGRSTSSVFDTFIEPKASVFTSMKELLRRYSHILE